MLKVPVASGFVSCQNATGGFAHNPPPALAKLPALVRSGEILAAEQQRQMAHRSVLAPIKKDTELWSVFGTAPGTRGGPQPGVSSPRP